MDSFEINLDNFKSVIKRHILILYCTKHRISKYIYYVVSLPFEFLVIIISFTDYFIKLFQSPLKSGHRTLTNQHISHGFDILHAVVWGTMSKITCSISRIFVITQVVRIRSQTHVGVGCVTVIFIVCNNTNAST